MMMSLHERQARAKMAAFRKKYGVEGAVLTGPATKEEMHAAREAMGNPETHEEWLTACKAAREKQGDD